ncbi:MAG: FecR domain-containing protein [Pyrinomonadaceae bacterium]
MKRTMLFAMAVAVLLLVGASVSIAQNTRVSAADKYLISATAGQVNYTEGSVAVVRADARGNMLLKGDKLSSGERVSTDSDSRAEVLLNPGSYLRLGADSEFEFVTTDLDDLRLKLHRGSAIFEILAENEFKVSVYTPKGRVTVINSGVYRVDLEEDGHGLLSVIEGQAVVGERNIAIIKEGQTATISDGKAVIGRFDRDKRDDLAEWSRSRSEELARVASSLKNQNVRNTLISTFNSGLWDWGYGNSFGVWVYDPFRGLWSFMPYYSGWRSPYGYYYGSYCLWYDLPPTVAPRKVSSRAGRTEQPSYSNSGKVGSRSSSNSRGSGKKEGSSKSRDTSPLYTRPMREPVFSPPPMREPVFSPRPVPTSPKGRPIDN